MTTRPFNYTLSFDPNTCEYSVTWGSWSWDYSTEGMDLIGLVAFLSTLEDMSQYISPTLLSPELTHVLYLHLLDLGLENRLHRFVWAESQLSLQHETCIPSHVFEPCSLVNFRGDLYSTLVDSEND